MHTELRNAIETCTILDVVVGTEVRSIEPHRYGIDADGEGIVVAFPIDRGTESLDVTFLKLPVARITSLISTGRKFLAPRPGYDPDATDGLHTIYAALDAA